MGSTVAMAGHLSLSRRNYLEKSLTQPFTSRYGTTPLMESERLVHATQPRPYINIEHHDAWRRAQQQPPFFEGVAPRAGQHEVEPARGGELYDRTGLQLDTPTRLPGLSPRRITQHKTNFCPPSHP